MKRFALSTLLFSASIAAAPDTLQLPAFPEPPLALDGGLPAEVSSIRLLRELHKAGLRGFDRLETADSDYALFRGASIGSLTTWLETVCSSIDYDLRRARARNYDGTVFARLLDVAASLGALQAANHRALAMPVGIAVCKRVAAWGELPGDGAEDVYVVFVTEEGMMLYDPPTRQQVMLADFPNKGEIVRIRF